MPSLRWIPASLALMLCAGCAGVGDDPSEPTTEGSPSDRATVQAMPSDRLPSTTPQDWVTYADAVVLVDVTDEERLPTEAYREDGEGPIDREVSLAVAGVVWHRPGAPDVPPLITYSALGWQAQAGQGLEEASILVSDDRPRIEVGHRYVMAIEWDPVDCDEGGTGVVPASWRGLGAGSSIPYDDGQLGVGEFAGEDRSLGEARRETAEPPSDTVTDLVIGQTVNELEMLLGNTASGSPDPALIDEPNPC